MKKNTTDQFVGCLLGGAVGDALGAAVEFMTLDDIRQHFGAGGIREYAPAYGKRGAITDDTQMSLFTAEGLILARVRGHRGDCEEMGAFVYEAYLRWLATQGAADKQRLIAQYGTCVVVDGILGAYPELQARRAPGNSCLSALMSGRMGTVDTPVNNSKGCGGVMRIAPVGLFTGLDSAFDCGCRIAAITHGHPSGYLAAGCLAEIICRIVNGFDIEAAVRGSRQSLAGRDGGTEVLAAVDRALEQSKQADVSVDRVASLGQGWVAEEALAIAVYCALCAGEDFEKGVWLAVNHGGDSDSTGAITGNILGVLLGRGAIPSKFTLELELCGLIEEMAIDLHDRRWR